jgi:hypothetical protein
MKLSKSQIDQLKSWISKKGYPEIDVQYEILDHVACRIEKLLEENPKLSLQSAFQKVHAEFGVFGFSSLEESYKKMIETRLRGYFWEEVRSLAASAKILLPLGLTVVFFQSSYLLEKIFGFQEGGLALVGFGFLIFMAFWWYVTFGKDFKKYQNYASWRGNQGILMFTYIPMQVMAQGYKYFGNINLLDPANLRPWQIMIVLLVFAGFVVLSVLPSLFNRTLRVTQALEQMYGEN